ASVNSLTGDSNSLQSLLVSAIPVGATLSDGHGHSFTASAGNTSVNVSGWTLSSLTVTPTNDANFTLTATATTLDADGNTSTASVTEAVTVNPLAPTATWGASTPGTEGAAVTLGTLAASVNSLTGDSNSLQSLLVSSIPVGATLSDGHGHSFTASAGNTAVNVSGWTLSSLTVTPTNDANFTLTATATTRDAEGNTSTASVTEAVIVNPLAPTATWGASTPGTEGAAVTLGTLAASVNSLTGDSNSLQSLTVSSIPVGATLSDGHGHSFTASAGNTSVNVSGWTLSSLTVTPTNDANFTLTATATTRDAEGNTSTASIIEAVTVNPLAPTATWGASTPGTEGAAVTLGTLAASVNSLTGDSNSLQSLLVSSIPVGATLSDGHGHSFTASAGNTAVNVSGWTLSSLTVTPTNDANFTLT